MAAFIAVGLLLAGCVNRAPAVIPETEVVNPPASEAPSVTPTEDPTPTAAAEDTPIGSKVAVIGLQGGYRAEVTIDWLPIRDMDPSTLPAECAGTLSYLKGNKDINLYRIVAVPARVTVNYPSVNGFVWPEAHADGIQLQFTGGGTCNLTAGSFGIYNLPSPAENSGEPVTLAALYMAEKTPDNPTGDLGEVDPTKTEMEADKVVFEINCPEEPQTYCSFPRPAG
jgi:hypothetical protein